MELFFIRHGIAVDRSDPSVSSDAERWLTDKGIKRMEEASRGFVRLIPELKAVYTSSYKRAKQTADIVCKAFKVTPELHETDTLTPGSTIDCLPDILSAHSSTDRIAIVGHEPDFSEMISDLISGSQRASIDMKKGGVACVEVGSNAKKGSAELLYLLPPKFLRLLGE